MSEFYQGPSIGTYHHPQSLYQQHLDYYAFQREVSVAPVSYHATKMVRKPEGGLDLQEFKASAAWEVHIYQHPGVRNKFTVRKDQALKLIERLKNGKSRPDRWVQWHIMALTSSPEWVLKSAASI